MQVTSWYAYYLIAGDQARDRHDEARRERLARSASGPGGGGHGTATATRVAAPAVDHPGAAASLRTRRWTLRLARLAVTVSVHAVSPRGSRS